MNNYDVDFFIRKFEAIPDEQWTVYAQMDSAGRRCALGHCQPIDVLMRNGELCAEAQTLQNLFRASFGMPVSAINNAPSRCFEYVHDYEQPTPKARVLAALRDIKAHAESALDAYETRPLLPVTKPEPVEVV